MLLFLLTVVLIGTVGFHVVTYMLWLYERRVHGVPSPPLPALPTMTAWLGEGLAMLAIVFMWPFGFLPGRRPAPPAEGRPVVLIHGWSMNKSSMALLAARLRRDGRDAYLLSYASLNPDMDVKALQVAEALRAIASATGEATLDVLAHSQGGVLIRAAARYHGALELLGNVVTLGSPHSGSALAAFAGWPMLRQLRPNARYLERLAEDDPVASSINLTTIRSNFDAVVFPEACSRCPGAMSISVESIGHMGLLFVEPVYRLAKENLDHPPRQVATSQSAVG
jgi:pimeloyl-ACP methyl ester carboxylesterase